MITLDDLNLSAGGDPNSLTIESQPWLGDAQLTWSNGQYAISYTAPDILWRPQQDQFTISVSEPLYGLESETVTVLVDLNPKGYAQYFNVSARRKKRRKKVSGTFFMASGLIPMNPHIFQYITTIGRLKVPGTIKGS